MRTWSEKGEQLSRDIRGGRCVKEKERKRMDDAKRDKQFLPYGFQKHSCKLLRIIELQYLLLITANTVIKLTPAERDEKKNSYFTLLLHY